MSELAPLTIKVLPADRERYRSVAVRSGMSLSEWVRLTLDKGAAADEETLGLETDQDDTEQCTPGESEIADLVTAALSGSPAPGLDDSLSVGQLPPLAKKLVLEGRPVSLASRTIQFNVAVRPANRKDVLCRFCLHRKTLDRPLNVDCEDCEIARKGWDNGDRDKKGKGRPAQEGAVSVCEEP